MESRWLRQALFGGMTANSFKLGTVLGRGWFWMRVAGCCVLYRGPTMEQIDLADILAASEQDADTISPPNYIPHNTETTYFYVVRRVNNCGYEEQTLSAAAKVAIDAQGELARPVPNKIFIFRCDQVDADKIELLWFYSPIAQQSPPVCFKIYYDGGTGQIDYENPLTVISYEGQRFHSWRSNALQAGRYLFALRAEDAAGVENISWAQMQVQLDMTGPETAVILGTEAG